MMFVIVIDIIIHSLAVPTITHTPKITLKIKINKNTNTNTITYTRTRTHTPKILSCKENKHKNNNKIKNIKIIKEEYKKKNN